MTDCVSLREQYFAPGMDDAMAPEWATHLATCAACRQAWQGLPLVDRALAEVAELSVSIPSFDTIADAARSAARTQRRKQVVRRSVPFFYTGLATAALAAGLVAAVLVSRAQKNAPKLLVPGGEIHATAEAKSAVLSNGVRIRLDVGSLKLATTSQETQTLLLPSGRVFVDVPKLPAGSTLSVRTPDAEVRVHGTRFQVIRTGKDTQVHVVEGLVEVRPEGLGRRPQMIRAGESTTIGSAEAYREGLRESTLSALDHGEFTSAEKQIGELLGSSADPVQQAEAQALLAWSLSARGKRSEAIERYRQVLRLLPEGQRPLWAENACAELAILVEQQSPSQIGATWSECLRRFPDGVHAALAKSRLHSGRGTE
jgi:ferric-dicitrate binding protein FerR (iron transport regulator)